MAVATSTAMLISAAVAAAAGASAHESARQARSQGDENVKQTKIATDKAIAERNLNLETEKERGQIQKSGKAALAEQGKMAGREGTLLGDFSGGASASPVKTLLGQ